MSAAGAGAARGLKQLEPPPVTPAPPAPAPGPPPQGDGRGHPGQSLPEPVGVPARDAAPPTGRGRLVAPSIAAAREKQPQITPLPAPNPPR